MIVVRDDLWLCVDCLFVAVNGDYSGIDYSHGAGSEASAQRVAEVNAGLERLGPHLVPDFDHYGAGHDEFRAGPCACCGSPLAGEFHRFAVLGDDPAADYQIEVTSYTWFPGADPGIGTLEPDDDPEIVSAAELLRANAEDVDYCAGIRALEIGQSYACGGGAAPYFVNKRIR